LSITKSDGSSISPNIYYYGLSGYCWTIDPYSSANDPIPGYNSGLTFTFSSPVNAFGFEIGDWATCCYSNVRSSSIISTYGVPALGSGLWISFDGGAMIEVANALGNPGYASNGLYTNFVAAIDRSNKFSKITFFCHGFGDHYLAVGGTIRFGAVPVVPTAQPTMKPDSTYYCTGTCLILFFSFTIVIFVLLCVGIFFCLRELYYPKKS
jgi:hypothetical protein